MKLTESAVVVEYLDTAYPDAGPKLFPKDPVLLAKVFSSHSGRHERLQSCALSDVLGHLANKPHCNMKDVSGLSAPLSVYHGF